LAVAGSPQPLAVGRRAAGSHMPVNCDVDMCLTAHGALAGRAGERYSMACM
jgi:hypothetical protein